MKRVNKVAIAGRFNRLDLHDDAFTSLKIYPPRSLSNFTRVDFEFQDDSTGAVKVLSFRSCANFRFIMDFDVLASNWHFGNTEACVAKTEVSRMKKFVRAQQSHWRTTYMPPMPKDKPIRKKLESIRSYVWFRVAFFGGTAEVLAKNYTLTR
jgi:hypothetical protein